MHRISSNLTLFYKLFFPTFYASFLGAVTIAALTLGGVPMLTRILLAAFYVGSLTLLAFTVLRLKRVEIDDQFVHVTNYFRHFRYPYHNIEKIVEKDYRVFRTATIYFHQPGFFGKTATFVPSGSLYNLFWNEHPELRVEWLRKN